MKRSILNKNHDLYILSFLVFSFFLHVPVADGYGPQNATCYELGNCDFFEQPFDTMLLPYQEVLGGFTYIILWSIVIGILWLRLGNTMAVGLVGLGLAVMFQDPFQTGVGFSDDAQLIGYLLLFLAIGIVLFQLVSVRTQFPTN